MLRIFQVDAFTDKPFAGNPAAVCLLPEARDAAWMQQVAAEMNLSETAYLRRRDDGSYDLRWFTPAVEVDLCGHATPASAHVLWEEGHLPLNAQARFHTRSGLLTADHNGDWIEMDLPAHEPKPVEAPAEVVEALGVTPVNAARNRFDLLIEVENEAVVRELAPDFRLLKAAPVRGVIVTAHASTAPYDFVSRFFAPNAGVAEDPATGSSFCLLTPYWTAKLGRDVLLAYQASARGGVVRTALRGDRVLVAGKAVTTLRAELLY